jgi:hypothetical protein
MMVSGFGRFPETGHSPLYAHTRIRAHMSDERWFGETSRNPKPERTEAEIMAKLRRQPPSVKLTTTPAELLSTITRRTVRTYHARRKH